MKLAPALLLLAALLAWPLQGQAVSVAPGVSEELAQWRAANISALQYALQLQVPEAVEQPIPGQVTISFELADPGQGLQLDFRAGADSVHSVQVNGRTASYRLSREHILLAAGDLKQGQNRIDISFTAGDSSLNRNPGYLHTLLVPDRARTLFPLFDQPDLKARYQLQLELPGHWQGLANGPLEQRQQRGERSLWRFAATEPISSYLFSFVAGDFQQVTRKLAGREMSLLHRETDSHKVQRNIDAIFQLHADALAWMEQYTGIPYPFAKLDFALIPSFPYGGMEHVGAIQYRASSLLLDDAPTDSKLLGRASLIAHEVAHMWFGNLVTMRWFNDVWTKEVFANFMAAKIVNPAFPDINHQLNFLLRHYPGAYGVDRSAGANPIRQQLPNLNQAGLMYGPIIYQKAPIMMRQLELMVGEQAFRAGMQEYLRSHAFGNATWPELIRILDRRSDADLARWSEVWVNTPGRPQFAVSTGKPPLLSQYDPAGAGRVWPQRFGVAAGGNNASLASTAARTPWPFPTYEAGNTLFNADGLGYGLFPASLEQLSQWQQLDEVARGSLLIDLYENLLEGRLTDTAAYLDALLTLIPEEDNQLLLDLALGQARRLFASLLPDSLRQQYRAPFEDTLWLALQTSSEPGRARLLYESYSALASAPAHLQRLEDIWADKVQLQAVPLSETDRIRLAEILALRLPLKWRQIIDAQLKATSNPDQRRRLQFITPSLSPEEETRDAFFASLAEGKNRETENWVLDALGHLHHPTRVQHSTQYIRPSLALLAEIQATGDIFFPAGWLRATLENHRSDEAVSSVQRFLAAHPDYNPQLRLKILQALDLPLRASTLSGGTVPAS